MAVIFVGTDEQNLNYPPYLLMYRGLTTWDADTVKNYEKDIISKDFILYRNTTYPDRELNCEQSLYGFDYVIRFCSSNSDTDNIIYTNKPDDSGVAAFASGINATILPFDNDHVITTFSDNELAEYDSLKMIVAVSEEFKAYLKTEWESMEIKQIPEYSGISSCIVHKDFSERWIHINKGWFRTKDVNEYVANLKNVDPLDISNLDSGYYSNIIAKFARDDGSISATYIGVDGYVIDDSLIILSSLRVNNTIGLSKNKSMYIPRGKRYAVTGWNLVEGNSKGLILDRPYWYFFDEEGISVNEVEVDGIVYKTIAGRLDEDASLFELDTDGILHRKENN